MDTKLTSGGFDIVEGSVRVRFVGSPKMNADRYEEYLEQRLQIGGSVQVIEDPTTSDLVVNFSYFGDK